MKKEFVIIRAKNHACLIKKSRKMKVLRSIKTNFEMGYIDCYKQNQNLIKDVEILNKSAIYYFYKKKKIFYIGQTKNVRKRLSQWSKFLFLNRKLNKIKILYVSKNFNRLKLEKRLIKRYKPYYNKYIPKQNGRPLGR